MIIVLLLLLLLIMSKSFDVELVIQDTPKTGMLSSIVNWSNGWITAIKYAIGLTNLHEIFTDKLDIEKPINKVEFTDFTWYLTTYPDIMDEIFSHHRNNDIFIADVKGHFTTFLSILFDQPVSKNDFIFSCDKKHSEAFRGKLLRWLSKRIVDNTQDKIKKIVVQTLEYWSNEPISNINIRSRELACELIGKIFLGYDGDCYELCKASNTIFQWFSDVTLGKNTVSQEDRNKAAKIMIDAINDSLESENEDSLLVYMKNSKDKSGRPLFTDIQIKTTAFTLFNAGQDTTATVITYALLKLAQNPDIASKIKLELLFDSKNESNTLNCLRYESLRMAPPITGISRWLKEDTTLILKDKDDNCKMVEHRLSSGTSLVPCPGYAGRCPYIYKSENLNKFDINRFANYNIDDPALMEHRPFGHGQHKCPGRFLFVKEFDILFKEIVNNYTLTTETTCEEPIQELRNVNSIKTQVNVKLIKN